MNNTTEFNLLPIFTGEMDYDVFIDRFLCLLRLKQGGEPWHSVATVGVTTQDTNILDTDTAEIISTKAQTLKQRLAADDHVLTLLKLKVSEGLYGMVTTCKSTKEALDLLRSIYSSENSGIFTSFLVK